MFMQLLLLLAGIILIIKGGDLFVSASIRIAEFLQIPRVVIGATLVSLATTSPELVVSVLSALRGESGLAIGNAVGSCICNIGLILGLMALIKHIDIHPAVLRNGLLAMFFLGAVLLVMTMDLSLSRGQGLLMIGLGLAYFTWDMVRSLRRPRPALQTEAKAIETERGAFRQFLQTRKGTAVQFAIGAGIVVLGSKLLVDSAVFIATGLGIKPIIVGLTVVAVGTSLPELVTAITSSRKNVSDLAVGNVIGANVANLTLIVGTAASLSEVTMTRATQLLNFPALLVMMTLLVLAVLTAKRITRREGLVMLVAYACYIALVVGLTLVYGGL
ncbi:MAG: calcium/sodium antiporter [Phycisphaerae bacterium]